MFIPDPSKPSQHSLTAASSSPRSPHITPQTLAAPAGETVNLSLSGRQLAAAGQPSSSQPVYGLIPVDQRPSAAQSADVILGFISLHLQKLTADGASEEDIDKALGQALKGFKQGLGEAQEIISGFGMMTEEVSAGIAETEQLVLGGLAALRESYLGGTTAPSETSAQNKVVTAYSERETAYAQVSQADGQHSGINKDLSTVAASYSESYQRNEAVDLQIRTRDGDIITLSFNSAQSFQNRSQFAASSDSQGAAAVLAYQRNSEASNYFSFSVEGHLDTGEQEALAGLLQQVSELSDEFFNGDFDKAYAMALEFEMDSSELSALSLDLARSSRATIVEAYTLQGHPPHGPENTMQNLVDELLTLFDSAHAFAEPQQLITDLLANQLAQQAKLLGHSLVTD